MTPDFFGFNETIPCECCGPRYTTMTVTVGTWHKWTKQEIEDNILELAKKLATASFLDRGDIRRRLKHWTDKLERYEQAEKNFSFKSKGEKNK